jgi:hypothetical protein
VEGGALPLDRGRIGSRVAVVVEEEVVVEADCGRAPLLGMGWAVRSVLLMAIASWLERRE